MTNEQTNFLSMVQIQDCVGWELPLKSWIQQILSPLAMPTTRLANRLY
ncbi:MAG: hypothetical protein SW833_15705 [Cyanobacteriota bacterium]|nr:hypothetical protein [Cyanobacteriota bacterium]